jgi:sugar/nucleoside kinase (ribokinase family)
MTVDVVCAGPPFLDIVFGGLARIPRPGEEVLASEVRIVPGAMANVAFALRQLDLDAVVCAPKGTDPTGRWLQELMVEAGVPWIGEAADSTSLSVALPTDGDRAFVTVQADATLDLDAIAALSPRAIVVNLPLTTAMPSTAWTYGVVGDPQVAILLEDGPKPLTGLRALLLNEREARGLTGLSDTVEAGKLLAARGCIVIVTRGARGVVAAMPDGQVVEARAVITDVRDTVGAGDLFTAAYIWADLLGRPLDERLNVATAYASLSLARPTPGQRGLTAAGFRDAIAVTEAPMGWLQGV